MDECIRDFLRKSKHLSDAMDAGKDVYSTIASIIFAVPYEQCLQVIDGVPNPEGIKRRQVAKWAALLFCCDWSYWDNYGKDDENETNTNNN